MQRLLPILALCLAVASCYAPISVDQVRPQIPAPVVVSEASLKAASKTSKSDPLNQAAATLDLLHLAHDRLAAGDSSALPEYNFLTARFAEQIKATGVKPWTQSVEMPSQKTRYVVRGRQPRGLDVNDRVFIATDTLEFSGAYAQTKAIESGAGAPLLAIIDAPPVEGEAFDQRFHYRTITAVVHFSGSNATVELFDVRTGTLRDKVLAFAIENGQPEWARGMQE